MMNHYFFKFGAANDFLKNCIKDNQGSLALQDSIPLSIFFNKPTSWKVKDYYADKKAINDGKDKLQIKTFFDAAQNRNTVFWLFDDLIYALIPQSEVYNGTITNAMDEAKYGQPKTVNVTVFNKFEKKCLPEAFASINSYQKYNRKTIVELKEPEKEIAEWVYTHSDSNCMLPKMPISKNRRFCFLSPLQFETLIFLIFHHNKIFCTTYRGGTLKDVDFKVRVHKEVSIEGMPLNGTVGVQVKKCDCLRLHPNFQPINGTVLIHLGKSDSERRIYGLEWIESCLKQLPTVDNWLNESLDFFKLSDDI